MMIKEFLGAALLSRQTQLYARSIWGSPPHLLLALLRLGVPCHATWRLASHEDSVLRQCGSVTVRPNIVGDGSKPTITTIWRNRHPSTSYYRLPSGAPGFWPRTSLHCPKKAWLRKVCPMAGTWAHAILFRQDRSAQSGSSTLRQ